ncbi:MAG: hypothetical protein KDJ50_00380 [Alphaproteobacteria bacterium]|nr:hypothetical protein [Alphaproteobacteria bacterium]
MVVSFTRRREGAKGLVPFVVIASDGKARGDPLECLDCFTVFAGALRLLSERDMIQIPA